MQGDSTVKALGLWAKTSIKVGLRHGGAKGLGVPERFTEVNRIVMGGSTASSAAVFMVGWSRGGL